MSVIRISSAEPGQRVSEDVKDRSGRTLLAAGAELTADNIKILKSWGVVEVSLAGEVEDKAVASNSLHTSSEVLKEVQSELDQRFQLLNRSHPFIAELYEVCLQRSLKGQE